MARPLYPWERHGTHCTGGWVDFRAGLDRCGQSHPHRHSIPGPSSPYVVGIETELPGPLYIYIYIYAVCVVLCCVVLCCVVLCCAVLCCAVLCCAVLCCAVQTDTLQCSNCSQQTIAKCQQSIYCVIRTSMPVSSRHILTSSLTE
jgi:hypothetical protein